MSGHSTGISEYLKANTQAVLAEITEARGSTPRETGTWMVVGPASIHGTIGGGQLEQMVIEQARELLAGGAIDQEMVVSLGPEIGQCCGGSVELRLTPVDGGLAKELERRAEKAAATRPHVYIFGHGHTGKALARSLSLLPLKVLVIETRQDFCISGGAYETVLSALPEKDIDSAPPGSAYVILTHDHALDFLIASRALARGDASYVGMIGSKSKRATFASWLREHGDAAGIERLVCPIGGGNVKDKRPEVIAALVAAELLNALLE